MIAGTAGGTRLAVPAGDRVRPTADRVKEAVFSSLGAMAGLRVLDLFAGTGGMAIEALSRGAAAAVLVEVHRGVAAVARDNLARAHVEDRGRVVVAPAAKVVAHPVVAAPGGPFDLVLLDPPYQLAAAAVLALVATLQANGGLAAGARVVLERDRHEGRLPPLPPWLALERERAYGDTVIRVLRHAPPPQEGDG